MASAIGLVFSNYSYVSLSAAIFTGLLMLLSSLSEYVFFTPSFVFYVPYDRLVGFVLILAVSFLSGLVIPMNVYRIITLQNKPGRIGGSFIGSIIGASAGACSCGPVGFAIISTFGTVGGVATSLLSTYEIPLRILSSGILVYVYYTTTKSLSINCKIG
ncbi:hypothetical protein QVH35_07710 [Candidatus Nitrosotenuis chungbukensis]|uniref:hypothetical protein n=1 Tax=Candidatus Nitrosotenuis chungbukensis TaxID=1353246 RepID=UPI0005B284C7|nr:hypothetical protein [Candidatus Nitrosotenuis chungbukensis]WKT57299.1 hypothetical protein QVH35_07710 [Candidatus Nitrosotenuis chungbukensis]